MKILLIDDDKDLCHLTKTTLEKHEYEVFAFYEAQEGIKHARSDKPNLILMDVMLPGLSGPDAVKIIKSDVFLRNVPVVFLTALVSGEDTDLQNIGLKVGAIHYPTLGKPYEIEKLLEIVKNHAR